MSWSESSIAASLSDRVFQRKCVVVVDNCSATGNECDLLAVTPNGRVIDVEIKISRSDLKADAKKEKWWDRQFLGWKELHGPWIDGKTYRRAEAEYKVTRRSHPIKVWKHYYAMPASIWTDDLFQFLPTEHSGVLLLSEVDNRVSVRVRRMAKPSREAKPLTTFEILNIARLASLRMWSAYKIVEDQRRQIEAIMSRPLP